MPNTERLSLDQRENHATPLPVRPAPAPLCTHIMPSGSTCGSPAVSGTALCYHHSAVKTALGKAANAPNIPFVFPEDRTSLQINYFLLLQAYTQGRIELRIFNAMQRLLRSMDANLGKMPLNEDNNSEPEVASSQSVAAERDMKKPAANVNAPSRKPNPSAAKPLPPNRPQPKASNAPFSFEEIAAQYKPLAQTCFLSTPDQPRPSNPQPDRLSHLLAGTPLTRVHLAAV